MARRLCRCLYRRRCRYLARDRLLVVSKLLFEAVEAVTLAKLRYVILLANSCTP
jgi:hypothetical protein